MQRNYSNNEERQNPRNSMLTENGIKSLLEESKSGAIVQVLSFEILASQAGASKKYKAVISDGFAKHICVFVMQAAEKIETEGSQNCIILIEKVNIGGNPPKKIIMILDMEVLTGSGTEVIGYPADYKEWQEQAQQYQDLQATKPQNLGIPVNVNPGPLKEVQNSNQSQKPSTNANTQVNSAASSKAKKQVPVKEEAKSDIEQRLHMFQFVKSENKSPAVKSSGKQQSQLPFQKAAPSIKHQQSFNSTSEMEHESDTNSRTLERSMDRSMDRSMILNQNRIEEEPLALPPSRDLPNENGSLDRSIVNKLTAFPVVGMKVRDLDDNEDCMKLSQAVNDNQVFSIDLFDKDGNKVSAVVYGEKAKGFFDLLKSRETHIFTNVDR